MNISIYNVFIRDTQNLAAGAQLGEITPCIGHPGGDRSRAFDKGADAYRPRVLRGASVRFTEIEAVDTRSLYGVQPHSQDQSTDSQTVRIPPSVASSVTSSLFPCYGCGVPNLVVARP